MKANPRFAKLPKPFWATVKCITEKCGYTRRGANQVKVPSITEIRQAFEDLLLDPRNIGNEKKPTKLAKELAAYFKYRAKILNEFVKPRLMDASRAKSEFTTLKKNLKPSCPLPMR